MEDKDKHMFMAVKVWCVTFTVHHFCIAGVYSFFSQIIFLRKHYWWVRHKESGNTESHDSR